MTYEEVYEYLKAVQGLLNNKPISNENAIQINDLAIKAVEKQIPKKPIKHYLDRYCAVDYYYQCPTFCNVRFQLSNTYHFCPNCGQPLDWSDAE